jgi:hypothetical protein
MDRPRNGARFGRSEVGVARPTWMIPRDRDSGGGRGAGDDSRVIGAVIDIPALIAWAERAASRHRSVKPAAANGGGPQGQALQTDDGEQTIEPAIGQCGRNAATPQRRNAATPQRRNAATPQRRNAAASAAALRHEGKMFAKFERIVKTANAHFD